MSRLTRDGTAEPVSRDQILRRERGQGNVHFPVQLTTSRILATLPGWSILCYICDDHIFRIFCLFVSSVYRNLRAIWREAFGSEMPPEVAKGPLIDMDTIHDKELREEFVSPTRSPTQPKPPCDRVLFFTT